MPDRLSDVINVKDWGALGNNSHNDAPNIQAAIDYCASHGGGTIYFPTGTYKCNSALEVGSNYDVGIILRGSSRFSCNVWGYISKGSKAIDNIERVENMTCGGLRLTRPGASAISIRCNIEASECENVTIAGCLFFGFSGRAANAGYGYPTNPPTNISCSIGKGGTVYASRVVNLGGIGYAVSGSGASLLSTSSENQDVGVRFGWGVRRVLGTSNASGKIRLQLASNLDLIDGASYYVNGVAGVTEGSLQVISLANVTDGVSVDLPNCTFTVPSSGGCLTGEIPAYGCTLSGHQCERCDASIELYNAHGCYVAANRSVGNDGTTSHGPIQTMAYVATPTPHILVTTVGNHNVPAGTHILQIYYCNPSSFLPNYSAGTPSLVKATSTDPNSKQFTYDIDHDPGAAFISSQGWNWPLRFGLRVRNATQCYVGNNYLLAQAAWAMVDLDYGGEAQNNASNLMVGITEQWWNSYVPWLMPTHSSRPLSGWQFMTCIGRALPSQLGPNTKDNPYQMVFADLPGQDGVYQPGPFEGQEYDIIDGRHYPDGAATTLWGAQVMGGGSGKYRVRYGGSPLAWRRIG